MHSHAYITFFATISYYNKYRKVCKYTVNIYLSKMKSNKKINIKSQSCYVLSAFVSAYKMLVLVCTIHV